MRNTEKSRLTDRERLRKRKYPNLRLTPKAEYSKRENIRNALHIKAVNGNHKLFVHEPEILELLEVIDGSKEDEELLGFLDYDKIKDGKKCRHIVIVLPYCASCDALEALIKNNTDKFRNLNDYEIINISGVDNPNRYKKPSDIKKAISDCEAKGKKTITLTVNRMLTGSTVPEWYTIHYERQEYLLLYDELPLFEELFTICKKLVANIRKILNIKPSKAKLCYYKFLKWIQE